MLGDLFASFHSGVRGGHTPPTRHSEIWLSRGTQGFDGAITDDTHRQTGNLRIGVNCIIVRAAKAVYVLNHIDDDPSRCTAVSSIFYDDLAESYHLIFDDWDSAIRRQRDLLIRLLPGPANGKRVLDCACGIGTQAIGLAMLGFTVEGSDTSTRSIERARREVSLRGLKAEFRNDDMRILSTARRNAYDAVIAMDNALPHLQCDEDIERALGAMRVRLRSGGVALVSLRDYGPLIAQRPSFAPASLYLDGKLRRIVHQVWDWQDERRYVVHLFITIQQLDGWHTRHFVGQYRAIAPGDVASLAVGAGFDDVRVLSPDDTGYYQPLIRAVAPATSSSG
jgi:SAM-dependent methyltransferase